MNQWETTKKALSQLEFQTGLVATVHAHPPLANRETIDNAVISFDKSSTQLVARHKNWAVNLPDSNELENLQMEGQYSLLISDYVSDELGAQLRDLQCNYLDRAGNAYLNIAPIFILIQGKTPLHNSSPDRSARLFTDTGLKVIFALLTNSGLLHANYRQIADYANVSMGTIGWVLRELKDQNFISETQLNRSWKNRSRLIRRWCEEYPKLRGKYRYGVFCSADKDWWKSVDLARYDAVLGGEIAAVSYTDLRSPSSGVVYVGKHKHAGLIRDLSLSKIQDAALSEPAMIEVCTRFWGKTEEHSLLRNSTHPLLTYADLMDAWDPASRDLARQIADKYLPGSF
ncbi:MAG: type IV toxin-antitoxin system AbiEi family antitoxin [Pseudomonadota bacterium]